MMQRPHILRRKVLSMTDKLVSKEGKPKICECCKQPLTVYHTCKPTKKQLREYNRKHGKPTYVKIDFTETIQSKEKDTQ